MILNFRWKVRGAQKILKKKNKIERVTLPDFKTFSEASHQDSMVLVKEKTYRSNGTEWSSET